MLVPLGKSKQTVVVPLNPLGPIGPGTVEFRPFFPAGPGGPGTVEFAPGAPAGPGGPGTVLFAPGFPAGPAGPGTEFTFMVMIALSVLIFTVFTLLIVSDFCASAAPLAVPATMIAATKTSREVLRTL